MSKRSQLVSPVALMFSAVVGAAAGGPLVLMHAMAERDDAILRHLSADDPAEMRAGLLGLVDMQNGSRAERRATLGGRSQGWRQ